MNANDVQLIMIISLNNDKSNSFKRETKDLMSLENIKKEALDYFKINAQNINLFKLTGINNEDIKKDEDIINIAYEDKNKNLVCEIKLLSKDLKHNLNEQKLSQKISGETKEKEMQENIINNCNSIETNKKTVEENKDKNQILSEQSVGSNIGETKDQEVEKNIENKKEYKISSNETILTDTEIEIQKMRDNNGTVSSNTQTSPSPSKIKYEDRNGVQKEKDAKIPKNENVEKLKEEKSNPTLTETEKNEIEKKK